jgi:hypothetical protein
MTTPQTRGLLCDVNCRRNPAIAAVEDVDRIGTSETVAHFTRASSSRREQEFYAESENAGKDFCWLGCWGWAAIDLELVRGRAGGLIQEIRPFLPCLNARQRELVLRTLQAAPKNQRQPKS